MRHSASRVFLFSSYSLSCVAKIQLNPTESLNPVIRIGDHYWFSFWFLSNKQHYLSLNRWTQWVMLRIPIKSYVSFAEYSLFHRALLQKRSIILSILPQWVVRIPKWKRLYSAKETYDLRIPIKSYVSFAEYSLFHRTLLQKRPIILSIFPQWVVRTSSTPSLSHGV